MRANYVCKVSGGTVRIVADTMLSVDQLKELAARQHRVLILDVIEEHPIGRAAVGEEEYDIPLKIVPKPKPVKPKIISLDRQMAASFACGEAM